MSLSYTPPMVEIWCTQQGLQELCIQTMHRKRTRQTTAQLRNRERTERGTRKNKIRNRKKQNSILHGSEQDKKQKTRYRKNTRVMCLAHTVKNVVPPGVEGFS